jgi:hypothetical protein
VIAKHTLSVFYQGLANHDQVVDKKKQQKVALQLYHEEPVRTKNNDRLT